RQRRQDGELSLVVDHPRHRSQRAVPDAQGRIMITNNEGSRARRTTMASGFVSSCFRGPSYVTGRSLSRRTFLRAAGAAIALPLLDAMIPAFTRASAATSVPRFSVVYVPNGVVMDQWTPAAEGASFELTPILQPLARFRDRITVITGLKDGPPNYAVHGAASTRFLTTAPPLASTGAIVEAGVSVDQVVARAWERETQLASLELSTESPFAGVCDVGSSCVYTDTIAWRSKTTPLPMEHNPRAVFERLFGEADTTDPAARLARLAGRRRLLGSVAGSIADLRQPLGNPARA